MPTIDLGQVVGDTGPQGATGAAAGFGEVTATVSQTTGTPSVSVTASGPNTQRAINFAFSGLKGAKGDKGDKGDDGELVGAENLISTFYPHAASGAEAVFQDAAAAAAKDLTVQIEPVQDLHGYDKPWAGGGGKNQIDVASIFASPVTRNGITFTPNDDGSIMVNGTATSEAALTMASYFDEASRRGLTLGASYKLLMLGNQGYNANVRLQYYKVTGGRSATVSSRNGAISEAFILDAAATEWNISIIINSGTVCENLVLYPMVCLPSKTDSTFEPYANICPITGWTGAKVTRAGKNLLKNTGVNSSVDNGVSFTKNADGSVTANGTNNGSNYSMYSISLNLPAGNYLYASGLSTADSDSYQCLCRDVTASSRAVKWDGTTRSDSAQDSLLHEIKIIEGHSYLLNCYVLQNTTAQNKTFYPMICAAGETDSTFEPYRQVDTKSISWETQAGTVYGGTLDVTTGLLTVTDANIASYNGETLPGKWLSDKGVYPGKNLLGITAESQTVNGLTIAVNKAAGTVTVNGTATATYNIILADKASLVNYLSPFYGQTLILTGCPAGGSVSTYRLNAVGLNGGETASTDFGSGVSVSTIDFSQIKDVFVAIRIDSGYTANNLVFRPMFRLTTETDDTFEPHLPLYGSQVVYKLATPLTYQLTPTEVKTILGYNRISADCGDVAVTYFADPLKSYEQKTEGGGEFAVSADSVFSGDGKSVADRLKAIEQAIVSLGGNI